MSSHNVLRTGHSMTQALLVFLYDIAELKVFGKLTQLVGYNVIPFLS